MVAAVVVAVVVSVAAVAAVESAMQDVLQNVQTTGGWCTALVLETTPFMVLATTIG